MPETIIDVMSDTTNKESDGIEIPFRELNPDTLQSVISEFVTREWEEMGSISYTLEQKVDQVMVQLNNGKAKLVFDPQTSTCNIIPSL